jgi:hypothetical protein
MDSPSVLAWIKNQILYPAIRPICLLDWNFFKKINFKKINSRKINYFLIFGSVMKNKLKNTFQCLVMSWKISWKITY